MSFATDGFSAMMSFLAICSDCMGAPAGGAAHG
jgi:hypothetical protein